MPHRPGDGALHRIPARGAQARLTQRAILPDDAKPVLSFRTKNGAQFKRWLAKQGCTFASKPGGGGHLIVRRGDREAKLPLHGSRRCWAPT